MRQAENDEDRWWTMIERVLSRPPLIFCLSPGTFESEAETARKELEAKYMRMRQLTSELRGRDLTLARLLEDKMRLLCEMLEELGVEAQAPLPTYSYVHLVQERHDGEREGATREQVLAEVQKAVKHQGGVQPLLQRRQPGQERKRCWGAPDPWL